MSHQAKPKKRTPWTKIQLTSVVRLYFKFRRRMLKGREFNINAECRELAFKIGKTRCGVEFVMQNVTAVLMILELCDASQRRNLLPSDVPQQFKPRMHFNAALLEIVAAEWEKEKAR